MSEKLNHGGWGGELPTPPPGGTYNAQQHVWLSQIGTCYWHIVGGSVKTAVKQENHLKLSRPKCEYELRTHELGHERPCMPCLQGLALFCSTRYLNLGSI